MSGSIPKAFVYFLAHSAFTTFKAGIITAAGITPSITIIVGHGSDEDMKVQKKAGFLKSHSY